MTFIRRHWYDIALPLALATLVWQAFARFEGIQLILLLNLAVIFLHQYEEYAWPGGEPWIVNEVGNRKGGPADRYPLNQNNAAFINMLAWPFYILPIFWPNIVWLGLAPVLFGMVFQVIIHGIVTNIKMKAIYNPGLIAVIFGHVPLGIWYLVEVYQQGLIHWWDWVIALVYCGFFAGVIMQLIGYTLLASKTSPYPFAPEELNKFDRLRRIHHAGLEPLPMGEPTSGVTKAPTSPGTSSGRVEGRTS